MDSEALLAKRFKIAPRIKPEKKLKDDEMKQSFTLNLGDANEPKIILQSPLSESDDDNSKKIPPPNRTIS